MLYLIKWNIMVDYKHYKHFTHQVEWHDLILIQFCSLKQNPSPYCTNGPHQIPPTDGYQGVMGLIMYASQQWFCTIKLLRHATMGWAKENELTYNSRKAYIIRLAQEYHAMCYIQSVYLFKVFIYICMSYANLFRSFILQHLLEIFGIDITSWNFSHSTSM